MASRKNLKKSIKRLTGDLIGECIAFGYFHKEANSEKLTEILEAVTEGHNELIAKINSGIFEKKSRAAKAHFKAIIDEAGKMPDLLKFE